MATGNAKYGNQNGQRKHDAEQMGKNQLIDATGWITPQSCQNNNERERLMDINNPREQPKAPRF